MKACVLDASVVARWWFRDEDLHLANRAASIRGAMHEGRIAAHVPDLCAIEVANAMWKLTRFSGWPVAAAREAVGQIDALGLRVHPSAPILSTALDLSVQFGVTVYDAVYVCLALSLEVPLFTADEKLVRKVGASLPFVRSIAW